MPEKPINDKILIEAEESKEVDYDKAIQIHKQADASFSPELKWQGKIKQTKRR
jgi:hypothetical protein